MLRALLTLGLALGVHFGARAEDAKPSTLPEGFVSLFNGKDLTGWKPSGRADQWVAEGGHIVCKGGGGGYLYTDKEFGDFEFRCEYKWSQDGGNSGVALRAPGTGDPAYVGMEIQLIDDAGWEKVHKSKLADYQHTGSIYDVLPAKKQANKPIGEWNSIVIVCRGQKVTVKQNGEELVSANLADFEKKFAQHPGLKREAGKIGFQSYNVKVEFRNVMIKELK